jgi:hypothetical protein
MKGPKPGDAEKTEKKKCEKNKGPNGKKELEKRKQKDEKPRKEPKTSRESKELLVPGKCVAEHVCASVRGDPHIVTFDGLK